MKPTIIKRRNMTLAAALVMATSAIGVLTQPAHAEESEFSIQGNAHSSLLQVGGIIQSGRTALATVGCSTTPGHSENNTAVLDLSPVGSAGATVSNVDSEVNGADASVTSTNEVASVSLLGGLVSADVLTARSQTTGRPFNNSASSEFVNLRILGVPYSASAPPNTRVNLPGLGYLILNEQEMWSGGSGASSSVNALHLVVTLVNPLGPDESVDLVLGHAQTGLTGPIEGVMDGSAYGTSAVLDTIFVSGRTAYQSLGCTGTGGKPRSNTILSALLPDVLQTDTVTSTVNGKVKRRSSEATVENVIERVNLLGGLITGDVVNARISGIRANGVTTFTDESRFLNLQVAGHPLITDAVAPNTVIDLGIATLTLHKVVKTGSTSIEVRMIELVSKTGTIPGFPLNTVVRVSVAKLELYG